MSRFASLCAMLLIGSLPAISASNLHNNTTQSRFQFPANGARATKAHSAAASHSTSKAQSHKDALAQQNKISKRLARPETANPPTGKLGFVAATQIPSGGGANGWQIGVLSGDFNGDGKKDLVSQVQNYVSGSWVYSISVVLSNGDGTFQAPILTPSVSNGGCTQVSVGDLNGDKKDDLIVVQQGGCTGGNSTAQVLLSNGDGTFTAGNSYTITSNYLAGGILADSNADGKLDIVAVDQNAPANVWTLLGNGDGTFQAATSVALSGVAGNYAFFADLNGDGLLDVADMDYDSGQLTVYLATSATTYASAVSYTTSDGVYNTCSLTSGDLSGDGKPEVVASNCNADTVTVYVNNGDGSFQTGVYYPVALNQPNGTNADVYSEAVSIGDVNGDGKADILSSNTDGGDITVLLGNGDGTFSSPTVGYATGGYPGSPAIIADFDGDGKIDVIVSDSMYSFVYLKGYGDGSFRSALDYYAPLPGNTTAYGITVASGDFNGDGYPDFVLGNCCNNSIGVTVFLSRPDGSLQPGVNYANSSFSNSQLNYVAVADFNKDGKPDIAAIDVDNQQVQIFTNNGDGTFTVGSTYASDSQGGYPEAIVTGDFNKDGFQDIAIANNNNGGQDVAILLNDGTGNFLAPIPYSLSGEFNTIGMAAADLNNDGKLDLIVPLSYGSNVAILLGNGDGTFQAETDLTTISANPFAVAVADFNGDGKMDMAISSGYYLNAGIMVALGNGDGTFQTPVSMASTLQNQTYDSPYTSFIQAVDIDGDGNQDLVYTNADYGTVGVLFGMGNGSFYDPVEYPSGGWNWGLTVADVNQDGAPDVVTAADDFSGVTVLLNNNGSGTKSTYTVVADTTTATITAGGSATFTLTLTPANHYNGVVTLSCGTLPAYTTCTFSPASIAMDGHTPVSVQLTITTTAVSASAEVPAGISPQRGSSWLLATMSGMGVFGMVFGGSFKKRNRCTALLLAIMAVSMTLVGCGGSDGSHQTTTTQTTPTAETTTTAVNSSQNPVIAGQAVSFNATVSATSGKPSGTVTFMDGTTQLGTGTLASGTASFQTSSLSAGTHNITASYAGSSSFKPSTSQALTQTIDHPGTPTGTYTIPVNAVGTAGSNNGNSLSQSLSVTVTVQ
jgi:Bacterial Ig-like domain (group 3)/FG-GAP-like repeat